MEFFTVEMHENKAVITDKMGDSLKVRYNHETRGVEEMEE